MTRCSLAIGLLLLVCVPARAAEPPLTIGEIREGLAGLEELAVAREQIAAQADIIKKGELLVGTMREQIAALERTVGYQDKALATAERMAALNEKAIDRLERIAALDRERADRAEAALEKATTTAKWTGRVEGGLTAASIAWLIFQLIPK